MQEWEVEWFGSKMVCYNCFQLELIDARRKAEEEAEECAHCGKKLPYWGYEKFQGHTYCHSCYDEAYRQYRKANSCTHCGKFLEEKDERFRAPDGRLLCQKCFIEARRHFGLGTLAIECAACKKKFPFSEMAEFGKQHVCKECFAAKKP